ncbi:MAG: short-chain dehydrogenase [Gammaproteobacteria bacterium]|nr:MAG: short-chain dehydrogenase [Gammaproteobacteria bacterium]
MKASLQNRTALVTGAASGIGEACARLLAEYGCRVALADINIAQARSVADDIAGSAVEIDVASADSVATAIAWVEENVGPIDILVTSAGVIQPPLPVSELPLEVWDRVVRIDQRGTYVTCRAVGVRMARRGAGSIINIASVAGMRSMPLHAYAPAKAAVISMSECLASEWGRSGVRVNTVSPGYARTPALQDAIDKGERDVSLLENNSVAGRLVETREIAAAVAFLASGLASGITGINLPVDVGWLTASSWETYGGVRE